jgi:hypothetical protein
MSIIRVDKDGLITINKLWRLVLRRIYDYNHAGESDKWIIEQNIQKWYEIVHQHNVKLQDAFGDVAFQEAVGRRGSITDEVEYQLEQMCSLLVKDEKGLLEDKKETYKRHDIDYRKVLEYRNIFPEMWPTKKDLARAKSFKEKNDKDNKALLN